MGNKIAKNCCCEAIIGEGKDLDSDIADIPLHRRI
jgi:hypothetical protein